MQQKNILVSRKNIPSIFFHDKPFKKGIKSKYFDILIEENNLFVPKYPKTSTNHLSASKEKLIVSDNSHRYMSFTLLLNIMLLCSIKTNIYLAYLYIVNIIQACMSIANILLLLQIQRFPIINNRHLNLISYIFSFTIFIALAICLLLLNQLNYISLIIIIIYLLITSLIVKWPVNLLIIIVGIILSFNLYDFILTEDFYRRSSTYKINILIYAIIINSFVTFVIGKKNKEQSYLKDTVDDLNYKLFYLQQKLKYQEKEVHRLTLNTDRMVNNINHEIRLPIGNIINFSELIKDGFKNYSRGQLKSLSEELYNNSRKLCSLMLSWLDTAMLNIRATKLNKKITNFSQLVKNRIKACTRIYLETRYDIRFYSLINNDLMISIDINYMMQAIDNLIINAITRIREGSIKIIVEKQQNVIVFAILNEGYLKVKYMIFLDHSLYHLIILKNLVVEELALLYVKQLLKHTVE